MHNARSLKLSIVMSVLFCLTLSPGTASAQVSCGGAGERACCLTERIPSCNSGLVEVSGCTTGSCQCQDGVSLFFGTKSSGTCVGPTSCGGKDERACCITETRYDSNPIPFSGGCKYDSTYSGLEGLTEVAGVPSGVSALCGGSNPFQIQSNGMCRTCGTEGVRACKVNGLDTCQTVVGGMLSPDALGICRSCGAQGQPTCALGMCAPGLHPKFIDEAGSELVGQCIPDRVVPEPDCNCTGDRSEARFASQPVNGYADLHLHMFSNLAFGGLRIWGDAFNKWGGISQALRADPFAQRTADRVINGHVVKGTGELVLPDLLAQSTIIHGTFHLGPPALLGIGTAEQPVTGMDNSGVQWNSTAAALSSLPDDFLGWPKWDTTTHQQAYYKWLERAYEGGLQLVVMLGVNNEAGCAGGIRFASLEFNCQDTMAAVKLQFAKARELEAWLTERCTTGADPSACAKNLASGEHFGWFKVVASPSDARAAIAKGRLAVVLGIEEATLFGCKVGACTPESVQAALAEYQALGVSHIFPVHNFDNGFGAAATWMNTIATANRYSTGRWYMAENCPVTPDATDTPQSYGFKLYASDVFDWFLEGLAASAGLGIPFWEAFFLQPVLYSPLTTTCNQQGLAPLGDFLVNEMMHRGMIIDVDHMSIKALDRTLQLAEAKQYPGIVASHVLTFELASQPMRHERLRTRAQLNRIARLGGMIAVMTQAANRACDINEPYPCVDDHYALPAGTPVTTECPGSSTTFAHMFEHAVDAMTVDGVKPPGIAFGTDFNGISSHNRPRFGSWGCANQAAPTRVPYPFTLDGFGTFNKQQTSDRVFDYNTDGLAHVGLLPDMVADLKKVGMSDAAFAPLFGSAEAYLRMWELAGAKSLTIPAPSLNDSTPPETVAAVTPAPNAAGWNTAGVTVSLTATDAGVGVQQINNRLTHLQTVTEGQTAGAVAEIVVAGENLTELKYGARDLIGNLETIKTLNLKIDTIVPTISGARTPAANSDGWNNVDVTVAFVCGDATGGSGLESCGPDEVVSTDATAKSVEGKAIDGAGNETSATVGPLNIDTVNPTISGSRLPAANGYGWNNTSVSVTFSCNDDRSGVKNCGPNSLVEGQGAAQSVLGTVLDLAGNTASTTIGAISIDKTAPTVTVTGVADGAIYTFGAVPTAACSTTDGLSGVLAEATPTVTGGTGVAVGEYVASCSGATDKAGNSGIASVTYSVYYAFTGFLAPLSNQSAFNPASAGTTVPVKFSIGGGFGLAIFNPGSPASTQVHCTTSAPLGPAVPSVGPGLFSYDPASGVYQYNWKTVAAWKNTCRVFSLGLNDGSTRTVKVMFK